MPTEWWSSLGTLHSRAWLEHSLLQEAPVSERWTAAHTEGMPQASHPRVPSRLAGKYASPPQIRSF